MPVTRFWLNSWFEKGTAGFFGRVSVVFIKMFLQASMTLFFLQQCVRQISHFSFQRLIVPHASFILCFLPISLTLSYTHTHTHTHSQTSPWFCYMHTECLIAQLHCKSPQVTAHLLGFVNCNYSTVTDLAKFLGQSTCKKKAVLL